MASVMNTCDRCGSAVPAGVSVCPNCGAPMGGVDASVSGVPAETVRTDFSGIGSRPEDDLPPLGTQMPVSGGQPASDPAAAPAATPWQEALPPAPGGAQPSRPEQQVFNAPPAAPARRFPWPWIIGCCLAIVLLACLLAIGLGGWLLNSFSFT